MILDKVKLILGQSGQDELLSALIEMTEMRLISLLGSDSVPDELSYIVINVTISRFNRIGSEGTSSHSVGSETLSFDSQDDFKPYLSDIERYRNKTKGIVRFL